MIRRKWIPLLALLPVFAVVALKPADRKIEAPAKGFALVELYTSEGCSSCPPADKLIAKIAQEYKDKGVYVLAYHVDYWNHLGWRDVFSSPQYSQRQRAYSAYLKLDGVYTPQAIVNGRTEFIGSEEGKMRAAIQQAMAKMPAGQLELSDLKIVNGKANIKYHINGTIAGSTLQLAVIQNHAQTQVKAGENNGHLLPHINIVQKLQAFSLKKDTGNAEVSLPNGFNSKDWSIIAFVQNDHTGEILAAQKAADNKELAAID